MSKCLANKILKTLIGDILHEMQLYIQLSSSVAFIIDNSHTDTIYAHQKAVIRQQLNSNGGKKSEDTGLYASSYGKPKLTLKHPHST